MRFIFIYLFLSLSLSVFGQESGFVIGPESVNELKMRSGSMSFIENRTIKIIGPEKLIDRKLRILKTSVPNFGFIPFDVWFRTKIMNQTEEDQEFYLVLSNANLDKANLYIFSSDGKLLNTQRFSDLKPYSSRENKARKPVYKIQIPSAQQVILLLEVNNGGEQFHFDVKFKDLKHLHATENNESFFLGFFMGILLFTILLNAYMFILTRDRLSMYYSLYLIALFLLQGSLLGFGKIYLWSDSAFMSNHANPLFASLSVYFLLYFVRAYLNLRVLLERVDRILNWFTYAVILSIVLSCIPLKITYEAAVILINILTLLLNLLILPVAFAVFRKGYKPALLFLIAFLILVLSVFAFVLKNFGLIPSNFLTDFGFQIGSAAEVLLFSLGIIIRFRNVQKEAINRLEEVNRLKEVANEELERKVRQRTQEIEDKKTEIEAKNKEIVSSIAYARRIQEAILPDQEKVQRILPNVKILYRPKDIVSGDFYWIEEKQLGAHHYRFFAVADCTGHGVPGAMMSVLCHAVLNRTLDEMTNPNAAEFLEKADQHLKMELSRNQQGINDGMDISLVIYCAETSELFYAGANNDLWIQRGTQLLEFDAVRRPIGLGGPDTPFELKRITLLEGDRILLFSDGIVDQFGGEKGKKLRKSMLREWVSICGELPNETMIEFLESKFMDWKGSEEQTDDVTVMAW